MGNGTPRRHHHINGDRWALGILLSTATSLRAVATELLRCTTTPLGREKFFWCTTKLVESTGGWGSWYTATLLGEHWAMGFPRLHHHIAWKEWAVGFIMSTTALQGAISGETPYMHYQTFGEQGGGSPLVYRRIAWQQWAVGLLLGTATLLGSNGQWVVYKTLPCFLGALGCGSLSGHYNTAGELWAKDLLQYKATLLQSSGH